RYQSNLFNSKEIALALVRRYSPLLQVPTLFFEHQNAFDLHIEASQSFSFKEPGQFSQYLENLGSPILPATEEINLTLSTNISLLTNSEDSLSSYSEIVTPLELSESH